MATHGTRSSYTLGCRCAECRAANARHSKEIRRQDREVFLESETEECERCGRVIRCGSSWMRQHRSACDLQQRVNLNRTEKVEAFMVRPSDLLVCSDPRLGPLVIEDVRPSIAIKCKGRWVATVQLLSHARWWRVPAETKFVRVKRSAPSAKAV